LVLAFFFSFDRPGLFALAAVLALLTIVVALVRRPAVHSITSLLCAIALILFALAAGGFTWHRPAETDVVVMVDLSASTRGAEYRNRDTLEKRIHELLGQTPHHVLYFSDHNTIDVPSGDTLADLISDQTRFAPPAAVAVVLFSDGRFDPPAAAPPVFAVTDPALDQPADAAVTRLQTRQNQLAVSIDQTGPPRRLTLDAAADHPITTIDNGAITFSRPIKSDATLATAQLNQGDLWPENDSLSLALAPPMRTQRWYVSNGPAPAGDWRLIRPADPLLADATQYLSPSVIVLDNLAAADLSGPQQIALEQYVRDLGGALIIAGGDHAFSQGFYAGSTLEALSPLASSPPAPAIQWLLLADSSGSMSQAAGNTTRWRLAASAIASLLPNLPPDDPVNVGSFAAELTWWSRGKSARDTAALALPPPTVAPGGPTNLAAALDRIARQTTTGLESQLLVISDADTVIDHPGALAQRLKAKKIHLHVLAIGDGSGLKTLQDMTAATGGTLRRQLDPARWAAEVQKLLASAWPKRLIETSTPATFTGDLAALKPHPVSPWNRTWLKKSASPLAQTTYESETIPLAARWSLGNGEVVACGFAPSSAEIEAIARQVAKPPRDPRFTVTWDPGTTLSVRIDAAQNGKYFNALSLRLELTDAQDTRRAETHEIPQVAPGRYALSLPAPRRRTFATLIHQKEIIDRISVAARYAPEFNAIGNDYDALQTLTQRTGGKVIHPSWKAPIDFAFPRRQLSLTPLLSLCGAIFLALGMARWRYG
jgi:hypothetical protein